MTTLRSSLLKLLDSTFGAFLCRLIGAGASLAPPDNPGPEPAVAQIRRILLIRPGGMGDMIVLLPVIRLLEAACPEASITLACEKRNAEVLELIGWRHVALLYDANPFAFLAALLRDRFDVAVDTEQFHHFSALFARLSRAPVRIGFKINPLRNPLYTHLVGYDPDGPEGRQFQNLLEPLNIRESAPALEGLLSPASLKGSAASLPDLPSRFAVVHPAASTPYKQWPPERFAEVAESLSREFSLPAVFLGSSRERGVIDSITARAPNLRPAPLSVTGVDLRTTAEIVRRSCLFVGIDSGLAHLAVAMGTPTVVLFGPSDHRKWGSCGPRHLVVRRNLPCAPCFIFGYHKPCGTVACMKQIAAPDVIDACRRLLSGPPP